MPGAAYFAQGGAEIGNNKANFRAIAAAAGVPTVAGEVCRSRTEAVAATCRLLDQAEAVVVQQAHHGAGVGNQILSAPDNPLATDHVGARHLHHLASGRAEAAAYWQERWDWASADGRHPVVVAAFAPHAEAIYSEHYADGFFVPPTHCHPNSPVAHRRRAFSWCSPSVFVTGSRWSARQLVACHQLGE